MKTIVTAAAFAAFGVMAAIGTASAAFHDLPAGEKATCRTLELDHKAYQAGLGQPPTGTDFEATGSIAPVKPSYIPYVNGAQDPDGLTSSKRTVRSIAGAGC